MNPQDQGNPFASILAQLQGGGQQMPQQAPRQPMAMPQQPVQGSSQQRTAEQYQDPMEEQLMPGKTGDNVKGLIQAITGLQSYIQNSTNPQMIQMLRQLIQVIGNILSQEQEELANGLGGDEGSSSEGGEAQSAMGQAQGMM
jgi:hypothetical protein